MGLAKILLSASVIPFYAGFPEACYFFTSAVAQAPVQIDRGMGTAAEQGFRHLIYRQAVITEDGVDTISRQIAVQDENRNLSGGFKKISVIFFRILHEIGACKNRASTFLESRSCRYFFFSSR